MVIAVGPLAVALLLGDAFQPLVPHLPLFMAYWWVASAQTPSGTALIGQARTSAHLLASACTVVVPVAVMAVGVGTLGFEAVPLGLLMGQAVAWVVRGSALRRLGYEPRRDTVMLLGACVAALVVASIGAQFSLPARAAFGAVAAGMVLRALRRDEVEAVVRALVRR